MDRFKLPDYESPILDECSCGCKTVIEVDDPYIRFEDDYFVDEYCFMKFMKDNFDIEIRD